VHHEGVLLSGGISSTYSEPWHRMALYALASVVIDATT